jgi:protein involved in polysaccharide export with SLBB domain
MLALISGGCNSIVNGWLDPTQVGRFRGTSSVQDLRRSISVADEPTIEMESSEPTSEDLEVGNRDYVLRAGDLIDISIFELMIPGQPWVEYRQISREGFITIPQIRKDIVVSGRTARELEKDIERILKEEEIQTQPEVTVIVREARNMTYNIMGAVGVSGSSQIPRPNFRILDAISMAQGLNPPGGPKQPTVKMAYVIRNEEIPAAGAEEAMELPNRPSEGSEQMNFGAISNGTTSDTGGHWVYSNGEWKFAKEESVKEVPNELPKETTRPVEKMREPEVIQPKSTRPHSTQRTVERAAPEVKSVKKSPKATSSEVGESWENVLAKTPSQRVIAIPLEKLEMGDPRYNIVIRDGDTILVPPPMQGEFYIGGNVLRPGVFTLTGREITLKQAVWAAGGLAPLADPSRCELVRRIGGNQEQIMFVNFDRIATGLEPDIILKPDDVVNVGTNPVMPFLAVLRNAFRATYGFGFVYDRNFADVDSFEGKQNPDTLERLEKARLRGF